MGAVERGAWQPRFVRIALADLDLSQRLVGDEAARQAGKMSAPLNSEDRARRADALALEVQDATGAAAEVDDTVARLDPIFSSCASESGARSAIWRFRRASSASPRPSR